MPKGATPAVFGSLQHCPLRRLFPRGGLRGGQQARYRRRVVSESVRPARWQGNSDVVV